MFGNDDDKYIYIYMCVCVCVCVYVYNSVRVSNELGAGHPKSAAFAVVIVTVISFSISLIFAILVLVLRHVISYAFTDGITVSNAVSELTPFLAVSILLNGVQPVLSGMYDPSYSSSSLLMLHLSRLYMYITSNLMIILCLYFLSTYI